MSGSKRPPGPGRGNKIKQGNGGGDNLSWGGPSKGAGSPKASRPHGKEGRAIQAAMPPEVKAERAERKAATRETMLAVYERVADDPRAPHMAQITAATHWLDRVEGRPVQTNLNKNTTDMRVTVVLKG